ncbi:uncharacterized protein DUF4167 [Albidovulum inexpectatum]|uniref:Uncharacterized protein DUF4167 n=1 Tax=Albidovulum inexpectatum TaxID=196587 RepID=A0A2S5JJJ8_9RHOB|nr:DUF4167 domain-containing protein [Albidovulum inexpectatum]PPB81622.1 uncharacterized protein DUF4167 [Albidovulum inexpectatum]
MRSSKNRSRSKSNRQRPLGNIVNRVFESSGPEGKVRGTPQQIIDKYLALARDAQLSNDRVAEQNFLQHAEHYTRLLSDAQREMQREQEARQAQQQNQQQNQQNQHAGGQGESGSQQQGGSGEENRGRNRRRNDRDSRQRDDALPSVSTKDDDEVLVETPESKIDENQASATSAAPVGDEGKNDGAKNDQPADEAKPVRKRSPRKPRTRKSDQAEESAGSDGKPDASPETPADAAE